MASHSAAPNPFENLAGKIEAQGMQGGMDGAFHAQSEALTDLALASTLGKSSPSDFSSAGVAAMLDSGPNGFHLFDSAAGGASGGAAGSPDTNLDQAATQGAGDIIKTVMGGFGALAGENTSNPWVASPDTTTTQATDDY